MLWLLIRITRYVVLPVFTGEHDSFLSGVASREKNLQNITFDKKCTDAWGNGYRVGVIAREYVGTFPSNENNKADYIIGSVALNEIIDTFV